MTNGERVKEIRKSLGMTLERFGERLGVGKTAISNIEKGNRNLTEQMALSICRTYKVNYDYLTTGEGEMFKKTLETDAVAAYVEELLDHEEVENPFYDMIVDMMKTYHELDPASQKAALEFFRTLRNNMAIKKED